ncbi:MAG: alpha/beta hydrolase [bacterium]
MPVVARAEASLYYEVHGDGPTLVLAHGAGGNTLAWWQQVPHFARHHRVVVFDHRGFGRSSCAPEHAQARHFADDLAAILDAADAGRCALVCQSMGGWTGMQFALAHPTRVAGLVLSGTPAGILTPKVLQALTEIAAAAAAQLQAPPWNHPHPALAADIFTRDPARGFLYAQIAALNPPAALAHVGLQEVMIDPASLVGWSIPTMLVGGSHDRLFAPDVLREVAAALPGAHFTEIPTAGHSPYFETAAAFNGAVEQFLASLRP